MINNMSTKPCMVFMASFSILTFAHAESQIPSTFDLALNESATPGTSKSAPNAEWLQPIDGQLRALREKDIAKAYYDYTTEDFRKTTSLEDFTHFVNQYSIFLTHHDVSAEIQTVQKGEAEILATLNPDEEAVKVQYRLIQSDGQWKIWNLNLVAPYSSAVTNLIHNPQTVKEFVSNFLSDLQKEGAEEAYDTYTSKEFKKNTSLRDFEAFLKKYSILEKFEQFKIGKPSIVETVATVNTDLTLQDGKAKVEIILGIQNDLWKIWSFKVTDYTAETPEQLKKDKDGPTEASEKKPSSTAFEFSRVEVGLGVDDKGEVIDPHKFISVPKSEIYVNLFVRNGKKGDRIDITLEHQGTRGALPNISTTLQQDGDSRLSFSFAKPSQGWPKGVYNIHAVSAMDSSREFTFEIR
jgi:hypothetical protein